MEKFLKNLLCAWGIDLSAPISLADCTVKKAYLLERAGIKDGTAFLFAVPYYTTQCNHPARNISIYAVPADYHGFCKRLFDDLLPKLQAAFPDNRFAGFSDHSPIDEREAAVKAGLGFFGRNHLLLTEKYSSFLFLGAIITDAILPTTLHALRYCTDCGACAKVCPVELDAAQCHSALTQKKGALTEAEAGALCRMGSAWGCDICQEACPITKKAKESGSIYTKIDYFKNTAIPHLTAETVEAMDEETFACRAYAWRGRETILRNLKLMERSKEDATGNRD